MVEVMRGVNVRQTQIPLCEAVLECPFCKFGFIKTEKGSACARCRAHVGSVTEIETCKGETNGSRR